MKINSLDQPNGKKIRTNEKINQTKFKNFQVFLKLEITKHIKEKHFYVTGIFQCV